MSSIGFHSVFAETMREGSLKSWQQNSAGPPVWLYLKDILGFVNNCRFLTSWEVMSQFGGLLLKKKKIDNSIFE